MVRSFSAVYFNTHGVEATNKDIWQQALLRYPTLTTAVGLAVAVPMATLVLRTPAARQTLLRIGKFAAEQEVWKYVRKLSKYGSRCLG